jgi:hypothetical protein
VIDRIKNSVIIHTWIIFKKSIENGLKHSETGCAKIINNWNPKQNLKRPLGSVDPELTMVVVS